MIAFFFQDIAGNGAWIAGVAAIVVIAGMAAFLAFKLLKRTVKMAFRMTIVVVILLAAIFGSLALWWFSSGGSSTNPRPRSTQTR